MKHEFSLSYAHINAQDQGFLGGSAAKKREGFENSEGCKNGEGCENGEGYEKARVPWVTMVPMGNKKKLQS